MLDYKPFFFLRLPSLTELPKVRITLREVAVSVHCHASEELAV